jgi:hypothetical protein
VRRDVNELESYVRENKYDGLFIHCGLHHLSTKELAGFVRTLSALPSGCTVVLVEPVYHDDKIPFGRLARAGLNRGYWFLSNLVMRGKKRDPELSSRIEAMLRETESNGWFLSPKEMPFTRKELTELFSDVFAIGEVKPVTDFGLRLAQDLALLEDTAGAASLGRTWIPVAHGVDRVLARAGLLEKLATDYLFTRVVMTRK